DPELSWSFGAFGPNNEASGEEYSGWSPMDQWTGGWIFDGGSIGSTSVETVADAPWGGEHAVRVFKAQNAFGAGSWGFETQVPEAATDALGSLIHWDYQPVIE